jgi:hypothetical protein
LRLPVALGLRVLLLGYRASFGRACSAAPAAAATLALLRLGARSEHLLIRVLVGPRLAGLLLLLAAALFLASLPLRLLPAGLLLASLPVRLLLTTPRLLALAAAWPLVALLVVAARFSGPLLEFADLLFHVAPRLLFVARLDLVTAAVGATFPPFGIRVLATGAEYGFRERHRRIGAHCTLPAVDENRRKTLLTLVSLAAENSAAACWDDRRAVELLRKEATREELESLGVEQRMIDYVFPENHVR